MPVALEFMAVGKRYEGHSYRTLRDAVSNTTARLARRGRPPKAVERALDDITFTVEEGESLALIGRNGAGKTTALKLATRIIYPTTGVVRVRGRVSALIEVGTGMHPELTGRENVQLFGRILGFKPAEIARRFDEIVEFAGVERALDYPVKYYSSGMQLRLGFSLAAHLEPDVLLVDEAIAVGDAGFQYRCVERMREVVRGGHTIVFVSHDMGAVETLCSRAILLDQGRLIEDGPPREVIRGYLDAVEAERLADLTAHDQHGPLAVPEITLHGADGREVDTVEPGEPLTVRLHYRANEPVRGPIFSVGIGQGALGCFALATMLVDGGAPDVLDGEGTVDCTFLDLPLVAGTYEIWVSVRGDAGFGDLVDWRRRKLFHVPPDIGENERGEAVSRALADAPVRIAHAWSVD